MNYICGVPVAACGVLIAYCTLKEELAEKIRVLHILGISGEKSKRLSRRQIVLLSMIMGVLCYWGAVMISFHAVGMINIVKMQITLICVIGAACNDYRERRIPNIFPLTMAVVGVACLAAGYLTSQNGAVSYAVSSLFATVVVTACMAIATLLTGNGIGIGDIKLLSALALVGGVEVIGGTLFFGMISCSVTAIVLLLTRKKTIKESIPFGPFIFIGYIISIFLTIY